MDRMFLWPPVPLRGLGGQKLVAGIGRRICSGRQRRDELTEELVRVAGHAVPGGQEQPVAVVSGTLHFALSRS